MKSILEVNPAEPSRLYYFGFGNNELIPIYNIKSVGDGDYHSEELIFPRDKGGKPNLVLLKIEDGEDTGKNYKNGDPVYKKKKQIKQFMWNGKFLSEKKR
ncbi:hypothetical protein [Flavobacterium sp. Root901]|uniref:hypothetical protein n=1 Tax=Flavobacterium sp. Root901 TaxID=1736605 RepID=UPI000FF8780B|nr:hypothetical protein [Flavobacterium sp. Root901]